MGYNNAAFIARSNTLSSIKVWYYRFLAFLYGFCGRRAKLIMVNSSWTKDHIEKLWKTQAHLVYPPCDVSEFTQYSDSTKRDNVIVSVGQYRPEKNHLFQLECFSDFLKARGQRDVKLEFIGGCKTDQHKGILRQVKEKVEELSLTDVVELCINLPFTELV